MKASELIEALREATDEHGDLEVMTEGCDCDGNAGSVSLLGDILLINRGEYPRPSFQKSYGFEKDPLEDVPMTKRPL